MELDKNLIKNNFKKSFLTYEDNAFAQKETARKLISLIKGKYFYNILEIGSYSGLLTRLAIENISCKHYVAVDVVEESEFAVKKINHNIEFHNCDIDNLNLKTKFDLILSNASLQWSSDLGATIKKLKSILAPKGHFALSIFQQGNLYEIKEAFNVGLKYPSLDEIRDMFSKVANIIEIDKTIKFDSPIEVLQHLKNTGVNSLRKNGMPVNEVKAGLKILDEKFNNQITYKSVIIID